MRFVFLSDTHLQEEFDVPEGDVLIHCGDLTFRGTASEVDSVAMWLSRFPHRHKVVIAGNHDWLFQTTRKKAEAHLRAAHATYLQDSSTVINGIRIYGSPWQPWFFDWAFNFPQGARGRNRAEKVWAKIPEDTDVLITHGPPRGILDPDLHGLPVGCPALLDRVKIVRPIVHAFGHLHSGNGVLEQDGTIFVNAAICDEHYEPSQPAHVLDIDNHTRGAIVVR
jgi:Icc-related predicted phosphoesterase